MNDIFNNVITLEQMTKERMRKYHREFENDPDVYLDIAQFRHYVYQESKSDAYWEHQQRLGRIHLAIMLDDKPIGEVILKNMDADSCTLSIHMQNDAVKNKGYGTRAELLALEYAFHNLGMKTVYADALKKNKRSRHVLQKVGFIETHTDDTFCYYRCNRDPWSIDATIQRGSDD